MTTELAPLFTMEHVEITYQEPQHQKVIVHDASFQLFPGEMVALTGPSGTGKSILAHAMVGLLEQGFTVTNGRIMYKDENIALFDDKRLQLFRRDEIALLIQHSLNGLDPIRTVKKQMIETLKQKNIGTKKEKESIISSLLAKVGFRQPEHILNSYPFQLSGGMRQRVLIAMILSLRPKILIADEPTTALDVINREKVLTLLKEIQNELGLTILLISHDEINVKKYADRILYIEQGGFMNGIARA
ncbi:ABC transporter ATP-binding protein [Lysinibacillus pakistanensis]|uniref:ATP-binding cassette domain-containing protein n=1 Tax=Lysinibacillus pakistanensis TaxID=759811 RepID=UPI003D2D3912